MYVDAINARKDEIIKVVERVNGERIYKEFSPDYHFYINDTKGTIKTIYGNPVKKLMPSSYAERAKLIKQLAGGKWESDVNVVFRCLEDNYHNVDAPELNIAFFDIETDFHKVRGYSSPDDAFNPITSIAIYLQWLKQMVCLAVPPKTMTWEEAQEIAKQVPDVLLFRTEKEMLAAFLNLIEDADILSGWNSEFYDIPYTVNRVTRLFSKQETRRFCLWNQYPIARTFDRGGKEQTTYDFVGRIHLDLMQLYKKYTYEERHSYALDAIAEYELGDKKVPYDGTLDHLYNYDFKKFLEYNIQDTALLDNLERKLQFIELANTIAHGNCVLIPTTMGSVAMIDHAVCIEAHERGLVVPNKSRNNDDHRAAGGWVAFPKKGLHKWVGSSDLNSLYPSVIRSLNMSPETIVGQVNQDTTRKAINQFEEAAKANTIAQWWTDRFCPLELDPFFEKDTATKIQLDMEDGNIYEVTGAELRELVFNSGQPWCISANGTIFRTDIEGIIPGLLTRWYAERKILQAIKGDYGEIEDNEKNEGIQMPLDLFSNEDVDEHVHHASPYDQATCFKPSKLINLIEDGSKKRIVQYMNQHKLMLKDRKVIARDLVENKRIQGYWDKRQLVKKINLNSAYGALLNAGSRFFDQRIGQSTTLTGRNITKHMAAKTNELIAGEYDHYGESCIYGDTDSTYFSAYPILKSQIDAGEINWTKENITQLYNEISDQVSDTFPQFMYDTFNVPFEHSTGVIKAGREIVAESGLYITKKRYAALVYDDEGKRKDINGSPGKVKAMGLDLRRSDTPKFVQSFLSDILLATLTGLGEDKVLEMIMSFKLDFDELQPWKKGSPKAVNNLTKYRLGQEEFFKDKMKGLTDKKTFVMPGHVRASLNWNKLKELHNDQHTTPIVDGQKIIVCKLKETASNRLTSIAYPVDELHLPDWFTDLPFDEDAMMESVVTQKIKNLLVVLKWDLEKANKQTKHASSFFDF